MKFFLWVSLLLLLGLNYWSSLVVEENLKEIKNEIRTLQRDLSFVSLKQESVQKKTERPHIRQEYPNLLTDDPFLRDVLPKLLPKEFVPFGIRNEGLLGRPEHLHPFNGVADVARLWRLLTVPLAENHMGKYEQFRQSGAIKIEARPRNEFWIHLREGMFWEPLSGAFFPENVEIASHFLKRHPLTAHDYKFYIDAVMNPFVSEAKAASLRPYFEEIEEIEVLDDLTFIVRWKILNGKMKYSAFSITASLLPLPRFVYQYTADGQKIIDNDNDPSTYRTNSIFALHFANHFAKNCIPSCGPYFFAGMDESGIYLKRNPFFYRKEAATYEGITYHFKQSAEGIWNGCKEGKIDLCNLAPSQVADLDTFFKSPLYASQVEQGLKLQALDFVESSYFYIGWNETTPYFQDKTIRKAMTVAIDRNRIISQNLNDLGITTSGPFFRYSTSYDEKILPWPFDPLLAKQLLHDAGWIDGDGDGILEKEIEGKKVLFSFALDYYAKNLNTKAICEYIATALHEVGVRCQPRGLDVADLSRSFEDKSFDAVFYGWSLGTPPEDTKQLWHSSGAKEKGSSNAIGFCNAEIDRITEELQYEYDLEKRHALYHQFHRIIHEECPYTFLYSPKRHLLYREKIQNLFIPRDRPDLVEKGESSQPNFELTWMIR